MPDVDDQGVLPRILKWIACTVSAHYSPAKWQILLELRKLFAERPVWSLLALQERISTSKMTIDSELLAKVGYVFRSGELAHL
jgi:hypothetical protein